MTGGGGGGCSETSYRLVNRGPGCLVVELLAKFENSWTTVLVRLSQKGSNQILFFSANTNKSHIIVLYRSFIDLLAS